LVKQGGERQGNWQNRFFSLDAHNLTYYKSNKSEPAGSISLKDIIEIVKQQFENNQGLSIATDNRVYLVYHESEAVIDYFI